MKADIDRAPYKSLIFERTSLIVRVYARNVLVGVPKGLGSVVVVPSQREKEVLNVIAQNGILQQE